MKKYLYRLLASLAAIGFLLSTGCRTTSSTDGTTATKSRWSDPVFVENTAYFVKATVANGVVIASGEDKNAASYASLIREVLVQVRGSKDYTPGNLERAIKAVPVKELKSKYAPLIITDLLLAYELYFGQIVRDKINTSVAAKLIDAAVAGIDLGLIGQAPAVPPKPDPSS